LRSAPGDVHRYEETPRRALAKANIERPMRPFHDGRHSAPTNSAASGNAPLAIQTMAGHASFSTTHGISTWRASRSAKKPSA
jgi:integrase